MHPVYSRTLLLFDAGAFEGSLQLDSRPVGGQACSSTDIFSHKRRSADVCSRRSVHQIYLDISEALEKIKERTGYCLFPELKGDNAFVF